MRNFVLLMYGIYQSCSVYLSRIAGKVPRKAKLQSTVKRLERFLSNSSVRVRDWYKPIAQQWLAEQFASLGEIHLIMDGTKVGFGHQLLMVSLAYCKRALPIAWTWVRRSRPQHRAQATRLTGLCQNAHSLPGSGFPGWRHRIWACQSAKTPLWHWYFVLGQKSDTLVWSQTNSQWLPFGNHIDKAGHSIWLGKRELSQSHMYPVNLLAHWKSGEKEPWCLATNLPDMQTALRFYKRRMWIKEMFGDMKKHGFDLECSMLHSFSRLSRLTLAVAFLYAWLISSGGRTIHNGLRHLVDRKDRRALSIFQIGLRFTERCLVNAVPIHISLCGYF